MLNFPNGGRQHKLQYKLFLLSRSQNRAGWFIPGVCSIPLCFGIGLAMYQPLMKSFKDNTLRGRIIVQRVIGFKAGIKVRHHQQTLPYPMEAIYLEVSGIFSDVGIKENIVMMCLFQTFALQDIIEYQRDAQGTDLNRIGGDVGETETKQQVTILCLP